MEERPSICRVAANTLNNQSRRADKGWSPAWGLGKVLTTPQRKKSTFLPNTQAGIYGLGLIFLYELSKEKRT